MATLLAAPSTNGHRPPSDRLVTVAILASPVRGRDGAWRVHRLTRSPVEALAMLLPEGLALNRVILNGRVIPPDEYGAVPVLAGDEVLLVPQWGEPFSLTSLLVTAAIGLTLSIATTALSYVLFPPPKAHNIQHTPDEPSFSFEGIRTTVGPGAPVPVIYGRQRVGGQLLSASVDQALTVLDNGDTITRVRAISTPATLTMLLALGEGPVAAIDPNSVQINGQPRANFPGVEVYTAGGFDPQAPLVAFGETRNTRADGRPIPEAEIFLTYTTEDPVDAFVLNIEFQSGLYVFNSQGDKVDNVVVIQYAYRIFPGGSLTSWHAFEVAANRTSVVRFAIRKENLSFARYDILVQLANVQSVVNAEWVPTLASVTEIQNNTSSYPHTALLGLRAVATDSLQGALPNMTVEVQGRTVRVGSFAATETYSDNPAWCVMDFLTNTRYGLGLPDAEIDLAAFQTYAAYCDQIVEGERRHTLNYVLDRDQRAQPVLLEMMGGNRTLLFKSEGFWIPRPTRNDTPVQLLSWASCTDLKLTYTRDVERINVIEARFANEEADFQQDVLTWPTLDNAPPDQRKASLEVRGVTKPSRVMRAMQFELNRRRFENLTLEATFSMEAIVLQPHDLFRFSHPLPGWGTSGRVMPGSTLNTLRLDIPVTFVGPQAYVVYLRHANDQVDIRPVTYPGDGQSMQLTLQAGNVFSQVPVARVCTWAFGHLVGAADTAVKIFRVVRMQRTSQHQVQLQAIIHNPSIYDEADALPLPVTTELFNPLGPPPPLTSLIAMELTRVQASGASLRVANLSWDVAQLAAGYAPYGGAMIQRRTVIVSSVSGVGGMGQTTLAGIQEDTDGANNFQPLTQVNGHVLDWDDYTVITGTTYVYRVIPVSSRGVPNLLGAREAILHIAGPTTPDYFPGTVEGLRLRGKLPGDTIFEGRDIHIEWDAVADSPLFTDTFFVQDYIIEVWLPSQLVLLHRTIVIPTNAQRVMTWTYTQEQNAEDSVRHSLPGAQRTLLIMVRARTNTGRVSLTPAQMTVSNPPPDMSEIEPETSPLFGGLSLNWQQYAQPRDFLKYEVYLDTVNPPLELYQGVGLDMERLHIQGLARGAVYYAYVLPWDTFGPGIPSQVVSEMTGSSADIVDDVPPATPTGLVLTTGTTVSADGTILTWVQAQWAANTESDLAGYQVQFFVGTSLVPTSLWVDASQTSVRLENVQGGVTIRARLLAYDQVSNYSSFTAEASITTGTDAIAPGLPTMQPLRPSFRAIVLQWIPPADLDYEVTEVWASQTDSLVTANMVGEGTFDFVHGGLQTGAAWYYWVRSRDTSGNVSAFYPGVAGGLGANTVTTSTADIGNLSITATKITDGAIETPKLAANAVDANKVTTGELITLGAQIRTAIINDAHITELTASKITTGVLQVLVQLGVAGDNVNLDGINRFIYVTDDNDITRVLMGRLGSLATQYGLQVMNAAGAVMFEAATGVTAVGITAGVINAGHLRTDTAIITTSLQLPQGAFAIIDDAHINTLSASKITVGVMDVLQQIGVGAQLFLDGDNANVHVYDAQSTPVLRAMFGKMLSGGPLDYGLRVWDPAGNPMWDLTSGATTAGITTAAVTTPKVAINAITESATLVAPGQVTTGSSAGSGGAIATGALEAGDRLWIMFKAVGQNIGNLAAQLEATLVPDGEAAVDVAYLKDVGLGAVVLQTVWTAPTALASKTFSVAFRNSIGSDLVGLSNRVFVALRLQR